MSCLTVCRVISFWWIFATEAYERRTGIGNYFIPKQHCLQVGYYIDHYCSFFKMDGRLGDRYMDIIVILYYGTKIQYMQFSFSKNILCFASLMLSWRCEASLDLTSTHLHQTHQTHLHLTIVLRSTSLSTCKSQLLPLNVCVVCLCQNYIKWYLN